MYPVSNRGLFRHLWLCSRSDSIHNPCSTQTADVHAPCFRPYTTQSVFRRTKKAIFSFPIYFRLKLRENIQREGTREIILQRQLVLHGHFFNLSFSIRLKGKVLSVLNPSHWFQGFYYIILYAITSPIPLEWFYSWTLLLFPENLSLLFFWALRLLMTISQPRYSNFIPHKSFTPLPSQARLW